MIKIYFDGACQPKNPNGNLGIGLVAIDETGEVLYEYHRAILIGEEGFKQTSNNVAEYLALIEGIRWSEENAKKLTDIQFLGDSQLVVKQMNGEWNINSGIYSKYALQALGLKKKLQEEQRSPLRIKWIPREENTLADELSTKALIEKGIQIVDFSQFKRR